MGNLVSPSLVINLPQPILSLLREFRAAIADLYQQQFVLMLLYGSYARQEAKSESDIDILLVLRGDDISPADEILRIGDIKTRLNVKYDALISVVPVSHSDFLSRESPLLDNVRREGLLV